MRSHTRKRVLFALSTLAAVLVLSSPWWVGPAVTAWQECSRWVGLVRQETVGDDAWQGFQAIKKAEGRITRREVISRLGEPVESVPPGSPAGANRAVSYGMPQYGGGRGGLLIYESERPVGFCFIYFDAHGLVEHVAIRSLE